MYGKRLLYHEWEFSFQFNALTEMNYLSSLVAFSFSLNSFLEQSEGKIMFYGTRSQGGSPKMSSVIEVIASQKVKNNRLKSS